MESADDAQAFSSPARRYEPAGVREARIVAHARAALRPEIALVEEVLAVYLDLLGAVEEEHRLVWPSDEARVTFEACLVRLFDDLLATYYLTLRGLYLQANRLWQGYLETLWTGLYLVREPAMAGRWLRGEPPSPGVARQALEQAGLLSSVDGELYAALAGRTAPTRSGFERALTLRERAGEWQISFLVGGEGNTAWLRRGVLDWLYVACHGLDQIDRLGVVPPDTQWSGRRAAVGAAAERQIAASGAG